MTTTETPRYYIEHLATDWIAWEVIHRTAKTITVRRMARGKIMHDHVERTVWAAVTAEGDAAVHTFRMRKDGTYRKNGCHALRPTDTPTIGRYWLD